MADNFFEEQSERSRVKVEIVCKYFPAWAKVLIGTQKRYNKGDKIGYIDLYAGAGKYADGTKSTPVRIMEYAIATPDVRDRLVAIFNDKDPATTAALRKALEELPRYETLVHKPAIYTGEVGDEIAKKLEEIKMIPTLSFVDPFGYKGLTQRLLRAMLKDFGCDLLFFFSYMGVNRSISNPMVVQRTDALFGQDRADALRARFQMPVSPGQRELAVLEELVNALKDMGGKFVLPFRFRDDGDRRTTHHLIFVSKHIRGYSIMKDIMASESSKHEQGVPSFEFCAADKSTPTLFELCRPLEDLEGMLLQEYAGKTICVKDLYEQHSVGRNFLLRNYKSVLMKMRGEGKIQAARAAGKAIKNNTFPEDVRVTFPSVN